MSELSQISELEEVVVRKNKEIDNLDKQLSDLNWQIQELQAHIKSLTAANAELLASPYLSLKAENVELKTKLSKMNEALEMARNDFKRALNNSVEMRSRIESVASAWAFELGGLIK